jgi:hypothetical protein
VLRRSGWIILKSANSPFSGRLIEKVVGDDLYIRVIPPDYDARADIPFWEFIMMIQRNARYMSEVTFTGVRQRSEGRGTIKRYTIDTYRVQHPMRGCIYIVPRTVVSSLIRKYSSRNIYMH